MSTSERVRKSVVITGATSGVGRATAHAFARRGAHVALLARGPDELKATRAEVEELGGDALDIPTDVADPGQVERAAEVVEAEWGPIDVWVNNAMTAVFAKVKDTTPEEFKRVTEVTYLGVVNGTLTALKRMLSRDRGSIVEVGSALAYRGIPLQATYCGAKHAIQGFVDSLRTELIHDRSGVTVTMVQLPALNTPQFDVVRSKMPFKAMPVPPIYQPEVAAEAIVFASENPRREVKVGASTVATIWGNRLGAGVLDRYLARTGIGSQQVQDEPEDPDRPDNLYEPIPGDRGTHGRFDDQAKAHSLQLELAKRLKTVGAMAGGIAIASAAALRRARA